ncbi:uncharacterized protein LOC126617328 [Malus sylvestris]|uniref:uncharacterized protein LOC126617328 n=1 Tax=Malus sylvestris TaxID=3752 RepID=UPI0021ACDA85|nr:uncharacterized protein LOC126617328 [Malus sylvestris]
MTEKPEPYLKTNRAKRPSLMPLESSMRLKDDSSKLVSMIQKSRFGLGGCCTSCGGLEGLVRTKEDAVDALFSVKDNAGIKRIIKRLNQTIVNGHKWSAGLHGRDSSPEAMSKQSNANYDLRLEISRQLAAVRREVTRKTLCLQDLECLHNALLHLEGGSSSHHQHPEVFTTTTQLGNYAPTLP